MPTKVGRDIRGPIALRPFAGALSPESAPIKGEEHSPSTGSFWKGERILGGTPSTPAKGAVAPLECCSTPTSSKTPPLPG